MYFPRTLSRLLCIGLFTLLSPAGVTALCAQALTGHKTQNVIVVMIDGMRWQEVFRGADPSLLETLGSEMPGDAKQRAELAREKFSGSTPAERRQTLMPFLWSVVSSKGQLFGNRDLGSDSHVINGLNFSYPGYSETLTGVADPRVKSNDNVPNPNATVFEWLNTKPEFAGKIAAFGAWNVFDGIFRSKQSGLIVNAGYDAFTAIPPTPKLELLNTLKRETVRIWPDEAFDPIPFHTAIEYLEAQTPRVLFLGLGETDEWAHAGSYAEYLNAAHLADDYLRQIWELVQSMPEYRDKTTLIVLPDHGRGEGSKWTDHGEKVPESMQTWMAFLGPDTSASGERKQAEPVTASQIAGTVAALLGEDYRAAVPKAGAPITDVFGK
ncbi:MAG: AP protein [Acidobacteria bacterium]|nr:AP protein [Acidobacteriota bacterium]